MSVQQIKLTGITRGVHSIIEWLVRAATVIAPPLLRIALAVPFSDPA